MKKLIIAGVATAIVSNPAYAVLPVQCWQMCADKQMDSSTCNQVLCNTCITSDMPGLIGSSTIITNVRQVKSDCSGSVGVCKCETVRTTYKCNEGFYGTATGINAGCTACPSNATCAGGNNSTFVCAKGYYKNGSSCSHCPSSGGVYGTTSGTGATSITECYLPSGTTGSDATGSFTYTSNCYYSN